MIFTEPLAALLQAADDSIFTAANVIPKFCHLPSVKCV